MNIENNDKLNLLKNKRNNLVNEQIKLNKRSLSGKQIGLYVIGLYAITIISLSIFSGITLVSGLIPLSFAVFTPIVMKRQNAKKAKILEIEINNINNQISGNEKNLNNENIKLENAKENVSGVKKNTIVLTEESCKDNDGPKLVKSLLGKKY